MAQIVTRSTLKTQNRVFAGTGGTSRKNKRQGFAPGFMDQETGVIYFSRNIDGSPAPFHRIDGLPDEVIVERASSGRVAAVKGSLVAGFIRNGLFYTREQAARALNQSAGAGCVMA